MWSPASCTGLVAAAAYSVSGNAIPGPLLAGLILVPITFLVGPAYALTSHARALWVFIALTLPLAALGLTYVAEALP